MPNLSLRYGAARHESVMQLRNALESLGAMKGVNTDEKGKGVHQLVAVGLSGPYFGVDLSTCSKL